MAFSPSDLSGLELWLKADANAYKDAGTTLAVNGDTIQQWNDQSGNANHASQATAGSRPTLLTSRINGIPVLYFNGSNFLDCANPNSFDIANPTIFVVGRWIGGSSFVSKNTTAFTDGRRRKMQLSVPNATTLSYSAGNDGNNFSTTVTNLNNFNIFGACARGGADHDILYNTIINNNLTSVDDSSFNTGTPVEIGAAFGNGAEALIGEIAEVIIYTRALSVQEYTNVINYLRSRFALIEQVDSFTASGNWVCPKGVTSVLVECWGGGGAGGGATSNTSGGGGGAGGQYARKQVSVVPGTSYAFTVGGSIAGATGNGTGGNDSTFNTNVVVAKGGAGGTGTNGAGGAGSTTSGVGDQVYAGGSGSAGASATRSGGGGGGGSPIGTGGSTTASTTGGTGSGPNAGAGGIGKPSGANAAGGAGNNYGGGGGGGYRNATTSQSGGAGAQGLVQISYQIPAPANHSINVTQAVNRSNTY